MAEATFEDVIQRMREEGALTRNSGANSIKSVKLVLEEIKMPLMQMQMDLSNFVDAMMEDRLANMEKARENLALQERMLDALEGLKQEQDDKADAQMPMINPGALATILAGLVGAAAGIALGQLKAIKFFTPKAIKNSLSNLSKGITNTIKSVRAGILNGFTKIKSFLTFGKESAIGKALASFKAGVIRITKPFVDAAKILKGGIMKGVSKVGKIFSVIGGYFKSLGAIVGKVAGIVGKIFAPIAIVLTLFETVQSAIDGYASGGILGGLKGAITGFFNALITKPLDLVKDAVAWVLGKLGFNESAEALNSFSFTEIFNSLVDELFAIVDGAVGWIKNQLGFSEEGMPSVTEFVTGLLTAPYDLVKSAVAWILDKFGFDEESEALSSFSFKDIFKRVIDGLIDTVNGAIDYIVGLFTGDSDLFADVGDSFDGMKDFFKKILRSILPTPDSDAEWYSIKNLVSKAIPDSVYEYAGLDPETGQVIEVQQPDLEGTGSATGSELDVQQAEANQRAGQAQGNVTIDARSQQNVSTKNENATVQRERPSSRKAPQDQSSLVFSP